MSQSIFNQVDILSKGLEAAWLRNKVYASNIANNDTPDYKRKDVKFQEFLLEASQRNELTNDVVKNIQPEITVDNSQLSYRMDGNNVDIDVEMARRSKNEIYYNVLINQVNFQLSQTKVVLNAK